MFIRVEFLSFLFSFPTNIEQLIVFAAVCNEVILFYNNDDADNNNTHTIRRCFFSFFFFFSISSCHYHQQRSTSLKPICHIHPSNYSKDANRKKEERKDRLSACFLLPGRGTRKSCLLQPIARYMLEYDNADGISLYYHNKMGFISVSLTLFYPPRSLFLLSTAWFNSLIIWPTSSLARSCSCCCFFFFFRHAA